jgi:nitrite reductase (cytochrome c-552)
MELQKPAPKEAPGLLAAAALLFGLAGGIGAYTFRYAEGLSYLSADPVDHWVRSPLLNVNRACQTCHRAGEGEMAARVAVIQDRNHALMQRGGRAIVALIDGLVAARAGGVDPAAIATAQRHQRRAQWRLDFIAAENSMGFHAPQEAARVLGEAIDEARQGQIVLLASGIAGAPVSGPGGQPGPQ